MSRARVFHSWLAPHFEDFVLLKQAGGAGYLSQKRILLAFDRYLGARKPRRGLTKDMVFDYLESLTSSPRARDNVVSVVWQAWAYSLRHGGHVEALAERPPRPPRHWRQRHPRIVSRSEVETLMAAARELPPLNILRPATMATLIGLLYTTGIRIGEALALDIGHLDSREGLITIVRGKFGKSRIVPLRETTVGALIRYIEEPHRPLGKHLTAPLFVSNRRRRLAQPTVSPALQTVCQRAELAKPWPRPHDFRHTFALSRVAAWYAENRNVDSLLPVLSTYLGHSCVENTRAYLTNNGVLLEHASVRFAERTCVLDGVSI